MLFCEVLMNENDMLTKIRDCMNSRGWTLYRLAKESNIPYTSLHSMFEKNTQPTISTLRKICLGLGITLSDFFSEDGKDLFFPCTEEENELLISYRKLNHSDKKMIRNFIERLLTELI